MDLRTLTTFIQVAESGSFTRAAQQLGYSQPTISVQIKQLEEELGVRLFDRIGHTVRLTDQGHDALRHAQQICHTCQEMVLQSGQADTLQGTIRLATADSMCGPLVSRNFPDFSAHYPGISLKIFTAGTGDLFRLLDHNEADLVCTLDSHIYNTNYIILAERRVGVHFVAATGNPLAAKGTVSIEELLSQPLLLTEKGMSYRRLLDEQLARDSLEAHPVLEMGRTDILCQMVEQGIGVSLLPDYLTAPAVTRGTMVPLTVTGYEPELWIQLLSHRDKWISPQMQVLIDHLTASLEDGSSIPSLRL